MFEQKVAIFFGNGDLDSFHAVWKGAAGTGCHERRPALSLHFSFSVQLLRKLKIPTPHGLCIAVSVTELLQAGRGSIVQTQGIKVGGWLLVRAHHPSVKGSLKEGKAQVAQGGFDTNLTLAMVFLWQNYFIEPADFFPPFLFLEKI